MRKAKNLNISSKIGLILWLLCGATMGFSKLLAQTWVNGDVGSPATAGSSSSTDYDRTLTGYGLGAGLPADDVHFTSQHVNSNVEIIAKLSSFTGGVDTAQAGLMLRKSLDSNAPFVSVALTKAEGLHLRYRTAAGAQAYEVPGVILTTPIPRWLRLVRSGDTIASYHSADGIAWELVGSLSFHLGADVYQGLFVSSGDAATQAQAEFQSVSSMRSIPQRTENLKLWLRSDAGIVKDGTGAVSRWEDQSGNMNDAVQTIVASQPQFVANQFKAKPVLRFNATANSFMTVPNHATLNPPYVNIFAVVKRNAGAASVNGVISKNAGTSPSGYLLGYSTDNLRSLVRGVTAAGPATIGDYQLISTTYTNYVTGGEMEVSLNDALLASSPIAAALTAGSHDLLIGRQSATTNDLDGDILEILIYGGVMSSEELAELRAYIHSKYGIVSAPPAAAVGIEPPPFSHIFSSTEHIKFSIPFGSRVYHKIGDGAMTEYHEGDLITLSETTTMTIRVERAGFATNEYTVNFKFDTSSALIPKAGLNLWLRSDHAVFNLGFDQRVLGWFDLCGKGNAAMNLTDDLLKWPKILTNRINGHPALEFDATEKRYFDILSEPATFSSSNTTILAVIKPGGTAGRIFEKWASSNGLSLRMNNATTVGGFINASSAAKALVSGSADQMILQTYDGAKIRVATYGTGVAPTAPAETVLSSSINATSAKPYIGGTAAANNFTGEIAEIMMFDRAITAAETRDLEAYVFARYNIGAQPQLMLESSVKTGIYPTVQNVTLSTNANSSIYYTLDGSDPVTNGTLYSSSINIPATATIKAYARKSGFLDSAVISEDITIIAETAEVPKAGLTLWLRADVGVTKSGSSVLAWKDQSQKKNDVTVPEGAAEPTEVDIPNTVAGSTPTRKAIRFAQISGAWSSLNIADPLILDSSTVSIYAIARRTAFSPPVTGTVNLASKTNAARSQGFRLQFEDGSSAKRGFLVNTDLITNPTSAVDVAPGAYDFTLLGGSITSTAKRMFVNRNTPVTKTGTAMTLVPSNEFVIGGNGTGTGFSGDILEVLVYDSVLSAQDEENLRAYAQVTYGIGGGGVGLPAPTASLASATYTAAQNLQFYTSVSGGVIRYTTNGTDPTETSTPLTELNYQIPLTTAVEHRIKAAVFKPGFARSPITERWIFIDTTTVGIPRSNMFLWLNASVGTEFGSDNNVSRWRNQSGNGQDAVQSTVAARPDKVTNALWFKNKPFLSFNVTEPEETTAGTAEKLTIPHSTSYPLSGHVTIFAVAKGDSSTGPRTIFDKGTAADPSTGAYLGPRLAFSSYTGSQAAIWASDYAAANAPAADKVAYQNQTNGNPHVIVARTNSMGGQISVDGMVPGTENFTTGITATTSSVGIGGRSLDDINLLKGGIAELIVYNAALTDAECAVVEAYLNAKYGFTPSKVCPAPQFSIPSGVYSSSQSVTLSAEAGGTIYYTTNGTNPLVSTLTSGEREPTNADTKLYSGAPISVTSTTRIKAMAVRPGYLDSLPVICEVVIDSLRGLVPSTDLSLWLRADAGIVIENGFIRKWLDVSGNNLEAGQSVEANRPSAHQITDSSFAQPNRKVVYFNPEYQEFMEIPHNSALDLGSSGSVFALFRPFDNGAAQIVTEKLDGTTGYSLRYSSTDLLTWNITGTASDTRTYAISNPPFVFAGGILNSGQNTLVVNGSSGSPGGFTGSIASNTQPLMLGRRKVGTPYYFNGYLAELWVYRKALTAMEVRGLQAYLSLKYGFSTGVQSLSAVSASQQSGQFESRLDLTLSHDDPSATIRYTVAEGSSSPAPTASGSGGSTYQLSSPIVLDTLTVKTFTVTAQAFRDGLLPGPATSWTYTLNPKLEVPKYGMILWLRSDQGVEYDGTTNKVTKWNDFSGLGNHAVQTVDGQRPFYVNAGVNGNPVIRFSSAALETSSLTYLQVPHNAGLSPSEVSVFAVVKRSAGTADVVVVEKYTASTAGYGLTATSNLIRTFGTNSNLTQWSIPSPATGFNILYGSYDKTKDVKKLFVDGIERGSMIYATDLTASSNPLYIGGRANTKNLTGDIAEIIIYSRPLSVEERMRAESYLLGKYALQVPTILTAPVLYPPSVASPNGPLQVVLTAASGAAIHYTLDGSTPTTGSPVYTGPIWIGHNLTLKAIAVKTGYTSSTISTGSYVTGQAGPTNTMGDTTPPVIDLIKPTFAVPQ